MSFLQHLEMVVLIVGSSKESVWMDRLCIILVPSLILHNFLSLAPAPYYFPVTVVRCIDG